MNCNLGVHPLHGAHKANAVMRARGGGYLLPLVHNNFVGWRKDPADVTVRSQWSPGITIVAKIKRRRTHGLSGGLSHMFSATSNNRSLEASRGQLMMIERAHDARIALPLRIDATATACPTARG